MPPVEFETTISADERSQTYALDRAATGIGSPRTLYLLNCITELNYLEDPYLQTISYLKSTIE